MRTALRIVAIVLGVIFTLQGIGWLVDPARAAAGLGMPLLDGIGRSTQIGDLATFFLTAGVTIFIGCRPGWARLLYVPAGVLLGAATLRTVAWAVHGADFATTFIIIELVTGSLLLTAARTLDAPAPRA